ncbi:universal stress protein [Comamonas composti]|uniref:universal stress protein n=1 Tax=Comamonas composti TaxID=408558 RepID=UPI0003F6AEF0|nr:universal stress protein [Comamonas composti]
MYNRILIASDGSELSDKAVAHGLDLAALCGAQVIALKVVPHYPRSYFEGGEVLPLKETQRIEAQWASHSQTLLDAIKAEGQSRKVQVTTEIVQSDLVAESVIDTAKRRECDLIVMASHGRKGLQRLLLGSETQHVLTHSHIPVLVLR